MTLRSDFAREGVVLCRGLVGEPHISQCLAEYASDRVPKNVHWNPVHIPVPADGNVADLATHSSIGRVVDQLIGEHLVYCVRLVVKNAARKAPVFLHQDVGYHVGGIGKLSAFVALTTCHRANGGMRFYLRSHRYGYLGDVGELNEEVLGDKRSWIEFDLSPGDVVFMHSATWHESPENQDGSERVMADIIFMPADDPARLISDEMKAAMFKRSRSSRLKELQAVVDSWKAASKAKA